jgi:hypothetical protein
MAIYRILRKNALFKGHPGDEVVAEPGPLMDAAVRSNIVTRIDVEPKKKSKKSD